MNDAAGAVMLPFARGLDLDTLASLTSLTRHVMDSGDPEAFPPKPRVMESDTCFRARPPLSSEGFSVAGPCLYLSWPLRR